MKQLFFVLLFFSFFLCSCSRRPSSLSSKKISPLLSIKRKKRQKKDSYRRKFSIWKDSHDRLTHSLDKPVFVRNGIYKDTVSILKNLQLYLNPNLQSILQTTILRYQDLGKSLLTKEISSIQKISLKMRLNNLKINHIKHFSPESPEIKACF